MSAVLFRPTSYFQYLIKRKDTKYIHSPFLFSLMQDVFNDSKKNRPAIFTGIELHRKNLISNNQIISFEDYGTGGDIKKNQKISISAIASKSIKQVKYARFLYRLIKYTKPEKVVELGTSLGVTTIYLALGAEPNGKVYSVEADVHVKKIANDSWINLLGEHAIEGYAFDLNEKLHLLYSELGNIDFLFIDANHRKEAMIRYLLQAMPYLHEKSVVVFDDINWSKETLNAWKLIKKRKEVTLSFDIFQMGILFFDKNLSKEDYTLKY